MEVKKASNLILGLATKYYFKLPYCNVKACIALHKHLWIKNTWVHHFLHLIRSFCGRYGEANIQERKRR